MSLWLGLRDFVRSFAGRPDHVIEDSLELVEARGGNNDAVAVAADVLGDAQETAAGILLQAEEECLPLDLDGVRF